MAIEKRGDTWRVRWRDDNGRERSRGGLRKRDAEALDGELKRLRRLGELATFDAGKETLAEFGVEWWAKYAVPQLGTNTRSSYSYVYDKYRRAAERVATRVHAQAQILASRPDSGRCP